jgi:hypothetical protein
MLVIIILPSSTIQGNSNLLKFWVSGSAALCTWFFGMSIIQTLLYWIRLIWNYCLLFSKFYWRSRSVYLWSTIILGINLRTHAYSKLSSSKQSNGFTKYTIVTLHQTVQYITSPIQACMCINNGCLTSNLKLTINFNQIKRRLFG